LCQKNKKKDTQTKSLYGKKKKNITNEDTISMAKRKKMTAFMEKTEEKDIN